MLAPPGFWAKNNKEMAVQLYCTAIFVLYFWIRGQFLQETQVYLEKLPINKENGLFSHQNNEFFIIYLFCIWGLYDIITAGQLLYFKWQGKVAPGSFISLQPALFRGQSKNKTTTAGFAVKAVAALAAGTAEWSYLWKK